MSMFVCLSVCPHITKFLCVLSMAVARASSGVVAIRYILPVLWMTLCLHIVARNRRREKACTQTDPPGGNTGLGVGLWYL